MRETDKVAVKEADYVSDFLWNPIMPNYLPQTPSMDTIKGFL